jgi:hypothetical protein
MTWQELLTYWFVITTFNVFVLGLSIYVIQITIESINRKGGIQKWIIQSTSPSTWRRLWND